MLFFNQKICALVRVGLCLFVGLTVVVFDSMVIEKTACAQPSQEKQAKTKAKQDNADQDVIEGKRREAIMKFVRENHPEMIRLIESLKKKHPEHYQRALRSIEKDVKNLNNQKQKDEKRYRQALEDWKLQSRIQLLSAQMIVEDTPPRRRQLRELLELQYEHRIEQLTEAKKRIQSRLANIEKQLKQANENKKNEIDNRIEMLVKKAQKEGQDRERTQPEKVSQQKKKSQSENKSQRKKESPKKESKQ